MSHKAETVVRKMRSGEIPTDETYLMQIVDGLANTARMRLKWGRKLRQERDEALREREELKEIVRAAHAHRAEVSRTRNYSSKRAAKTWNRLCDLLDGPGQQWV